MRRLVLPRLRLLPRSLAARTALVLLLGLVVVQAVGLAIHALDRIEFARLANQRETGNEVAGIYRLVADSDPLARDAEVAKLRLPPSFHAYLTTVPVLGTLSPAPEQVQRALRHHIMSMPMPPRLRPIRMVIAINVPRGARAGPDAPGFFGPDPGPGEPGGPGGPGGADAMDGPGRMAGGIGAGGLGGIIGSGGPSSWHPLRPGDVPPDWLNAPRGPPPELHGLPDGALGPSLRGLGRNYAIAMQLPDDQRWLTVRFVMPLADPFLSPTLPLAFLIMTIAAGLLSVWAVRRLTAPLRILAVAAERLGRDVNSDPLPENGPTEVATAAIAFNTMATRIRRFVTDRTLMLTAIGHDLRTPITRLKLRAEFIDDEELQAKFLSDLDELEAMVSATLAFGRDSADREPMVALDLNALLSTILDDAVDGRPELADRVGFAVPPPPVTIQARSLGLKRSLANLIGNAICYGGGVRVTLNPPQDGHVVVLIEDDGPGIPAESLERVFEPFVRIEASRNRETGGTGLGLSIARNIVRGQGGDIALSNRAPHGLKATVTLVA